MVEAGPHALSQFGRRAVDGFPLGYRVPGTISELPPSPPSRPFAVRPNALPRRLG
jgi:hypothetical protein